MAKQPRGRRGRRRRAAGGAWYWCATCAQRWQRELIPELEAEGCPLCGGEVVPVLGHGWPAGEDNEREDR